MRNERALQYRKATQMAFRAGESTLTNSQRLTVASIYDLWNPNGIRYAKNAVVRVVEDGEDCLYTCIQEHVSQENWKPGIATASLWTRIDVEHAGTKEDPIPAKTNMQYYKDKYYSEDGKLYLCTRDSGIPLAYLPSQLVGQYFEVVAV